MKRLLTDEERNEIVNKFNYHEKEFFFKYVAHTDDIDSYLICGIPRKIYDEMILRHQIENHIATKEIKQSKEFKQFKKECDMYKKSGSIL